ncbi:hypothetical protein [Bacillus cereus]|uniref:N4-gp56 family major capsid protein n=1 Tax=Bacillus cereus TaxID=1396 RepID=A0A9X8NUY1_BACCE|nr:hypothetical protein [Bacillus cereus]RWQ72944.1 hypothetical protein DR116_0016580 [Bacillus cereus]
MTVGTTHVSNVKAIVPEVIADGIADKLTKYIKFTPLAEMDFTLQAQPGMTVVFPTWQYIGDAKDVAEGGEVDRETISAVSTPRTVKKAAKDIAMTDESVLATNGKIVAETEGQLAVAIASKVDQDLLVSLREARDEVAPDPSKGKIQIITQKDIEFTQAGLAKLRVAFGEDLDNAVLLISSADYGEVLAMKEFVAVVQGQQFMQGHVGHVMGLNIVVTDRLDKGEGFLLKAGGIGISLKRQVIVETERLMKTRSNVIGADIHYVTYVKNARMAQAVKFKQAAPPAGE